MTQFWPRSENDAQYLIKVTVSSKFKTGSPLNVINDAQNSKLETSINFQFDTMS